MIGLREADHNQRQCAEKKKPFHHAPKKNVTADEAKCNFNATKKSLRGDKYKGEVAEKIKLARKSQQNARGYCREY